MAPSKDVRCSGGTVSASKVYCLPRSTKRSALRVVERGLQLLENGSRLGARQRRSSTAMEVGRAEREFANAQRHRAGSRAPKRDCPRQTIACRVDLLRPGDLLKRARPHVPRSPELNNRALADCHDVVSFAVGRRARFLSEPSLFISRRGGNRLRFLWGFMKEERR